LNGKLAKTYKKYNNVVHDEIKELDKYSIAMFVQHASKKVAVRQIGVMLGKCQHKTTPQIEMLHL